MKKQSRLAYLILLLLVGCEKEETGKVLDFQQFTLEVPAGWESYSLQGTDSKVGGIRNREDKLEYDYGWYSYDFRNETTATHARTSTVIDGKDALIVRPLKKGKGVMGVFIQVSSQNKFSLSGRDIKDEDTAMKIFRSVRF